MSILTPQQRDSLTELISIAFGLTAAKLSEVAGYRVSLSLPTIRVHPISKLVGELEPLFAGPAASIHQVFTGPISGDAVLLLNYDGAVKLSNLLVEPHLRAERLDPSTIEILTEVGNMLLGACLGMFGNLLEVRVSFSVPSLHLDSLDHFLTTLSVDGNELQYGVVVTASFNILEQGVDGRIVLILGVSSLDRLISAVERWEQAQVVPSVGESSATM